MKRIMFILLVVAFLVAIPFTVSHADDWMKFSTEPSITVDTTKLGTLIVDTSVSPIHESWRYNDIKMFPMVIVDSVFTNDSLIVQYFSCDNTNGTGKDTLLHTDSTVALTTAWAYLSAGLHWKLADDTWLGNHWVRLIYKVPIGTTAADTAICRARNVYHYNFKAPAFLGRIGWGY